MDGYKKIRQNLVHQGKVVGFYEDVITQLDQFDQSLYGMGPMYALDGYFAKVGYTSGDEEYLVKDIDNAINDKALSDELSGLRFLYQQE